MAQRPRSRASSANSNNNDDGNVRVATEDAPERDGREPQDFMEEGGMLNLATLKDMSISKLASIAKAMDVPGATGMRKQELIFEIMKARYRRIHPA